MKKLLLLFVVMLGTIGAYAQSSTTPIKGDVNEDGVVDVADINAIIEIMKNGGGTSGETKYYWYVGTTKPTSLSEATVVDSYPAEYTFTNPSMEEKCYVYVLTNSDKTVNMYDPAMPTLPLTIQTDITTINGYKITYLGTEDGPARIAKGGSVIIRISDAPTYYWYIGGTQPTSVNPSTWQTSTIDAPFTTTVTATPGSDGYVWCAFPEDWDYDITDSSGFGVGFGFTPANIKTSISGYIIYRVMQSDADTWSIKFTKKSDMPTCYWYVGTTKPTSLSEATIVDKYETPYTYINNSGEKSHIFVLTNSDKTVIFEDIQLEGILTQVDVDETTIPGYKIWETAVGTANTGSIRIYVLDDGWKYFYVGTTQPTAENYETLTPQYSSLSDMNGATVQVPSNGKIYVMMPKSETLNQSQIKRAFTDNEGNIVTCINRTGDNQTIPVHMIWELTFESGTTLTFKDPTTEDAAVEGIKSDIRMNGVIYNVRGQKLTSPQKGINIVDKRKVIVR